MEKIGDGHTHGGLSKIIPLASDSLPQGEHRADGVVLRRRETSPKSGECLLFLRGMGALWVGIPGPGKRFGGAVEPMTWGSFLLYQGPRRLYLKGVDVAEDFLAVRGARSTLTCGAGWCRELAARLPMAHENDGVLSLFWGSMKNLSRGMSVPLLDARFAWRWGGVWGVAPSFDRCPECGACLAPDETAAMTEWGFLCRSCDVKGASVRRGDSAGDGIGKKISPRALAVLRSSCASSAEGFIRYEREARLVVSSDDVLEREVKAAAEWLFSFLRIA